MRKYFVEFLEVSSPKREVSVQRLEGDCFHLEVSGQRYTVEFSESSGAYLLRWGERVIRCVPQRIGQNTWHVRLGEEVFRAVVQSEVSLLTSSSEGGEGNLEQAPMPGNILEVRVQRGQEVEKGEILFILEAMKMETELKAKRSGKVQEVCVEPHQSVSKDQVLMRYE
ncbi:MAG: acetyl-CoA carboxylase biotin carboxyl carrier protein subunit [Planctomycetota bacterium]|nr:MAG: acetyl-CoA carboxylase biotin carboxyl carrier protein subunit [Planctomycetota bacterium]